MARTGQPQMAADQAAAEGSDLRWSQFKELATLVLGSDLRWSVASGLSRAAADWLQYKG